MRSWNVRIIRKELALPGGLSLYRRAPSSAAQGTTPAGRHAARASNTRGGTPATTSSQVEAAPLAEHDARCSHISRTAGACVCFIYCASMVHLILYLSGVYLRE